MPVAVYQKLHTESFLIPDLPKSSQQHKTGFNLSGAYRSDAAAAAPEAQKGLALLWKNNMRYLGIVSKEQSQ